MERGHVVAQGHARLRFLLGELLDTDAVALSPRMVFLLGDMRTRWEELDRRIAAFDAEFAAMARADVRARRLTEIPGIGALNATALVAAVGDAATFAKGRDLAAWLGLAPRQATTGGRPKLLGITKRGSKYLRKNANPGRAIRHAHVSKERHCNRGVAARTSCAQSFQCRCRRISGKDGANRVGLAPPRAKLQEHAGDSLRHIEMRTWRKRAGCDELRVVKGRWPDSLSVSRKPPA
ncbi:hypothetical protein BCH_02247 [Brucella sp. 191011898]|nr:hypothetical protein BCH_02247 [Brucella sp. 191011898]